MARKNRQYGNTGIYHVMLRGVNKQRIFEWPDDYAAFLDILQKTLTSPVENLPEDQPNYKIHAYCLMDNHVHLIIGELPHRLSVSEIVTRITTRYAQFFNHRYHRVGHLFQDRFRSEPCDDEQYFFRLLDYIHNNPVKGGICQQPEQYPYSSFAELCGKHASHYLCSTELAINIQPEEIREWVSGLALPEKKESLASKLLAKLFPLMQAKHEGIEPYEYEQMVVDTLLSLTGADNISQFQQLDKATMRSALAQVRDAGVASAQLSRLTGISEGIIRRCKNPDKI